MEYKKLILQSKISRRIFEKHPWVFSNEIKSNLKDFQKGELVDIYLNSGKFFARGFVNPNSLIAARILTYSNNVEIDKSWFEKKLFEAFSIRDKLFNSANSYRMVYGESDGLPGLIIDKYNNSFSMQVFSAGMDNFIDVITDILVEKFKATAVIIRNDIATRKLEGLEEYKNIAYRLEDAIESKASSDGVDNLCSSNKGKGAQPVGDEITHDELIEEDGLKFAVNPFSGQKTGFFFDQRLNRRKFEEIVKSLSLKNKELEVLDVFSFCGAWAMRAARGGAKSIIAVDSSPNALFELTRNAKLNSYDNIETIRGDAFEVLNKGSTLTNGENLNSKKFDIVAIDPPAFIKSKKDKSAGYKGYVEINRLAMRKVKHGGLFVTSSCSHHLSDEEFYYAINEAAVASDRKIRIIYNGHQSYDHPELPNMPETRYLKCAFVLMD